MNILLKQVQKYSEWYLSMTEEERQSFTGQWVKERIKIYSQIISDAA